jgi:hypothetical protein
MGKHDRKGGNVLEKLGVFVIKEKGGLIKEVAEPQYPYQIHFLKKIRDKWEAEGGK